MGKDFTASSLVFMLRTILKQRSKQLTMQFLNDELHRWRSETKSEAMHFGKFTWDLLDYDGPRNYPKGKWSKGMDTGKVTKFIELLISQHDHGEHEDMLATILDGCQSIGVFSGLFFLLRFSYSRKKLTEQSLEGIDFFNAIPNWLEWLWIQTRHSTS